jgi:hypothetical protein
MFLIPNLGNVVAFERQHRWSTSLGLGVEVIDTPNVLPVEPRRHPQASYLPAFLTEDE